jgi:hypothetical protein
MEQRQLELGQLELGQLGGLSHIEVVDGCPVSAHNLTNIRILLVLIGMEKCPILKDKGDYDQEILWKDESQKRQTGRKAGTQSHGS